MSVSTRLIAGITRHFMMRSPEWLLSAAILMFSFSLLFGGPQTMKSPAYAYLSEILGLGTWGFIFGAVALLRMTSLTLNGSFKPFARFSPALRSLCATASAFLLFLIAISLYKNNNGSPIGPTFILLAVTDLFLAFVISGEAGRAEAKYRHDRS